MQGLQMAKIFKLYVYTQERMQLKPKGMGSSIAEVNFASIKIHRKTNFLAHYIT